MSNLSLVTSNFAVSAGAWMGETTRFQLVDFTPKTPASAAWAKDRTFYLFGGSGNTLNSHRRMPAQQLAAFKAEDRAKLVRTLDEIEDDHEAYVEKTETSLRLMDGFLEYLGKPSLRHSVTTSLYGENKAYFMKDMLRRGNQLHRLVLSCLRRSNQTEIWVAPHITPYIPYAAMLFIKPDLIDGLWNWRTQTEGEFLIEPYAQETSNFDTIIASARRGLADQEEEMPEFSLTSIWNAVHTQALARIYGAATVYVQDWDDEKSYRPPYEGEGHVLKLQKDDERALRQRDVTGFILAFNKPLWQATDLALISSMQMFEQGAFRFMLIDQENSSS